jgi:hypothetical protein
MPKRELADRILDEILTLRRPSALSQEFDESLEESDDQKHRQDSVLRETVLPAASRRQLIVE